MVVWFPALFSLLILSLHVRVFADSSLSDTDRFNFVLGTQTFGPSYHFSDRHPLLETIEVIEEMGASVVKFGLGPASKKDPPLPQGINSLLKLARDSPVHREALEKRFAFYVLWLDAFSHRDWQQGFPAAARDAEYHEIYEFVCHLLNAYSGTGKTFYLGHWEGDGMLRHTVRREDDARVTPAAVQGMIEWLSARQQAVDDAKRDTPHHGVEAWHYTEVNHVVIARNEGRPAVVNSVLPKVAVDFVSYSSYDSTNRPEPQNLKSVLDYIESKLHPKPEIGGKRVFIGEYGFPVNRPGKPRSPGEQDAMSRTIMCAALEWGCPFVLYWELYNNEVSSDGTQVGFWMINDRGEKQPVFHTHQSFFRWSRAFVSDYRDKHGAHPQGGVFRDAAVDFLNR